jgi:NAD(P)-dependent dehydrogenase (short-subunit alcohol dehydrogenase family)
MITARMNRIMASRVVKDNFRNRRLVDRCYHATRLHLKKTALVVGSSGCLGSTVAKYLSREEHMNVIGADVVSPDADDSTLHDFVLLSPYSTLGELTKNLAEGVELSLSGESLSAIVVASGAWQMDPTPPIHIGSSQEPAQIYGDAMETMMKINFNPVAAAGYIAHAYMGPQGRIV